VQQAVVETERDEPGGWRFTLRLRNEAGESVHEVRLAWADHELWSHGRLGPAKVIEALGRFLLARQPRDTIKPSFDAAVVRRRFPEVDTELPASL